MPLDGTHIWVMGPGQYSIAIWSTPEKLVMKIAEALPLHNAMLGFIDILFYFGDTFATFWRQTMKNATKWHKYMGYWVRAVINSNME